MAFVVDDITMSFESLYYVRRALANFVDSQMQPGDLVAILRTSGGISALHQFTTDKHALHAAIDNLRYWLPADRIRYSLHGSLKSSEALTVAPGRGGQPPNVRRTSDPDAANELFAREALGAVTQMAKGLTPLPGRKSIVLFSDGLNVLSLGSGPTLRDASKRLVDAANQSSVVIYTIHAVGLQSDLIPADSAVTGSGGELADQLRSRVVSRQLAQGGLEFLAAGTGGRFVHDTNDLNGAVARILEDQQGYYLIGWTPQSDAFEFDKTGPRFNSVVVRVTRPGLEVRTRIGYYGIPRSEGTRLVAPARRLVEALASPFVTSDVRVNLTPLAFARGKKDHYVRAMLGLDARDFTFVEQPDGTRMATVEVLAAAYDLDGSIVRWDAQQYTVRVSPEAFERVLANGLLYTLLIPLEKADAYQIRAVARDAGSGRLGSAYQFVEVPDPGGGRLSLSSLVVGGGVDSTGRAMASALTSTSSLDESSGETSGFVHPAVRRFGRGALLLTTFQVYNAGVDRSTERPRLRTQLSLYRDGKQVMARPPDSTDVETATGGKWARVACTLRLPSDLEPGRYDIRVEVTDLRAKKSGATAENWSDFTIE